MMLPENVLQAINFVKPFVPYSELQSLIENSIACEEKEFFQEKFLELEQIFRNIPSFENSETVGHPDSIVHAHYFVGDCHWYITHIERSDDPKFGNVAWGFVCLGDPMFAEFGTISIDELCEINFVELDLYFEKITLEKAKKIHLTGERVCDLSLEPC